VSELNLIVASSSRAVNSARSMYRPIQYWFSAVRESIIGLFLPELAR